MGIPLKNIVLAFFIILAGGIIQKIFKYILQNKIKKWTEKTNTELDDLLIEKIENPICNYIILTSILIAKNFVVFPVNFEHIAQNTINAFFIINTGYLFFNISSVVIAVFIPFVKKTKIELDDNILKFTGLSAKIFITIITAMVVIDNYAKFSAKLEFILTKSLTSIITVYATWLCLKLTDTLVNLLKPITERTESKLDDQLLPVLKKIIKVIIVIIGVLCFLKNLNYDISALIAGLGLGGVAIALAAKDTISNFFGSIMIFIDHPFQIGDTISIEQNVGKVIEIGIRSTRIQTVEGTVIAIPNSIVASQTIENISRRPGRMVKLILGLEYGNSNLKIKECESIVRGILNSHQKVLKTFHIYFSEFGNYSLNILAIYWVDAADLEIFATVQNEINLEIKELLEKANVKFAFPTQTIFITDNKTNAAKNF